MQITKKALLEELKGYLYMLLACVAYGSSTSLFLADNSIIAGGVTGLSVLINYLNPSILIGMVSIAINIPILALGLKFQGWKFIIRCLITVATHGIVTDIIGAVFPDPLTTDGVLASLYGGICQGIGIGLFVRYQFSSGGTELLGRIVSRATKQRIKIPVCVAVLDGAVVLLGAIVTRNPANMLYALIVVFVSVKISEVVLVGLEKSKLCIIITDEGKEVSDMLLKNSPRGVTKLEGEGMYTHKDRDVLLTCVKKRQLNQLKQLVYNVDRNAFIIVNDSVEVRGKGFQALDEGLKKQAIIQAQKECENEV